MFATVHLRGTTQDHVLTITDGGGDQDRHTRSVVIVADDGSHFRPTLVRVGAEHGGRSEILDGLEPGQNVVASGAVPDRTPKRACGGLFENLAGSRTSPKKKTQKPETHAGAVGAIARMRAH